MGNIKLKTKFAGLIIVLIAVSLVANLAWTSENKRAQMENELREKGMVLTQQMRRRLGVHGLEPRPPRTDILHR